MIISLADIFDALSSDRPYRRAFTPEATLAALEDLVGVHFDLRIFEAFKAWLFANPDCLTRTTENSIITPTANLQGGV
jgi:HD-GYP domain-containing protein (c-di-GMP phosphodiesterase class II)